MNVELWNKSTKQVFLGKILACILGIVAGILGVIAVAALASDVLNGGGSSTGVVGVLSFIVSLGILAGDVLVFLGIMGMKNASEGEIQQHVQKLWLAAIFSICAIVIGWIPVIGSIIGGILSLLALIFLLIGYSGLKNSAEMAAFSPVAALGFKSLFTAEILAIIGTVVAWIPLIGIVGSIVCLVAYIMELLGWKKVSTPVA